MSPLSKRKFENIAENVRWINGELKRPSKTTKCTDAQIFQKKLEATPQI